MGPAFSNATQQRVEDAGAAASSSCVVVGDAVAHAGEHALEAGRLGHGGTPPTSRQCTSTRDALQRRSCVQAEAGQQHFEA